MDNTRKCAPGGTFLIKVIRKLSCWQNAPALTCCILCHLELTCPQELQPMHDIALLWHHFFLSHRDERQICSNERAGIPSNGMGRHQTESINCRYGARVRTKDSAKAASVKSLRQP